MVWEVGHAQEKYYAYGVLYYINMRLESRFLSETTRMVNGTLGLNNKMTQTPRGTQNWLDAKRYEKLTLLAILCKCFEGHMLFCYIIQNIIKFNKSIINSFMHLDNGTKIHVITHSFHC